jgi:hypothetical protein
MTVDGKVKSVGHCDCAERLTVPLPSAAIKVLDEVTGAENLDKEIEAMNLRLMPVVRTETVSSPRVPAGPWADQNHPGP